MPTFGLRTLKIVTSFHPYNLVLGTSPFSFSHLIKDSLDSLSDSSKDAELVCAVAWFWTWLCGKSLNLSSTMPWATWGKRSFLSLGLPQTWAEHRILYFIWEQSHFEHVWRSASPKVLSVIFFKIRLSSRTAEGGDLLKHSEEKRQPIPHPEPSSG